MAGGDQGDFAVHAGIRVGLKRELAFALKSQAEFCPMARTRSGKLLRSAAKEVGAQTEAEREREPVDVSSTVTSSGLSDVSEEVKGGGAEGVIGPARKMMKMSKKVVLQKLPGNIRELLDGLMWYKDLGHHVAGDFSMAVVQANNLLEDQSQIESGSMGLGDSGPRGTFVGVYDGHGGPETARFVADHLFAHLKTYTSEQRGMSVDVICKAFSATEERFISLVRKLWQTKPQIAAVGACCLVGIICGGLLYIANAGDSRAVLGSSSKSSKDISAQQLSAEHNASIQSVREELQSLHPDDPQIVVPKHNVWRVKGLIQVSRSIGDAYLKNAEFNKEPLISKFRLPKPFDKPILSAEPSIVTHKLCLQDQFVIFASDGLWEHMSNQEAVDIVCNNPRNGIARKLVKTALQEAAKKREMRYSDLKKIDRGVRRHFHDDITVVVLFIDPSLVNKSSYRGRTLSLRAAGIPIGMEN